MTRRRIVLEIREHFDDCVRDLRAQGLTDEMAMRTALERLGRPEAIAEGFRVIPPDFRTGLRRLTGVRTAWIAVAAAVLVTGWAAELPPTSGAKSRAAGVRHRTPPLARQVAPRSDPNRAVALRGRRRG